MFKKNIHAYIYIFTQQLHFGKWYAKRPPLRIGMAVAYLYVDGGVNKQGFSEIF